MYGGIELAELIATGSLSDWNGLTKGEPYVKQRG
jgi:hypothetical protein